MSKEGVLEVLKKASDDVNFYSELAQDYVTAVKDFDLSSEEAMRIGTGDMRWLQSYLGSRVDRQLIEKVFIPLLSREQW